MSAPELPVSGMSVPGAHGPPEIGLKNQKLLQQQF